MQIRRPLCSAAMLFVLTIMLFVYGGQKQIANPFYKEGEMIYLTGKVSKIEYKPLQQNKISWAPMESTDESAPNQQMVVYLKQVQCYKTSLYMEKKKIRVMCYMTTEEMEPRIGQWIKVKGQYKQFTEATNPGEFNSRQYYETLQVAFQLYKTSILGSSREYSPYYETLHKTQKKMTYILETVFDKQDAAILKTMLLGDKSTLDTETKVRYQDNGIIHILAISGLHISILGIGLYYILTYLRFPVALRSVIAVGTIISYGFMTGMSPSCQRAVIMFAIHLFGQWVGRTYDMITALALIAVIMLLQQPQYVKHSGFLLSFGAIMAIGLFLPSWRELWLYDATQKKHKIVENILTGSAITMVTLPILLYYNYTLPIYALFLNMIIIPSLTILVSDGIIVMCIGTFSIPMAKILGLIDHYILYLYQLLCTFTERLPGHNIIVGRPAIWQIVLYYLLLIKIVWGVKKEIPWVQKQFVIMALFLLCIRFHNGLQIQFLDVGQGDCIIIRNENGNCYMMDGGSTTKKDVGTYQIIPYLESQGIYHLTGIFVSHPDEDHVNGILTVLDESNQIQIDCLILPDVSDTMKKEELREFQEMANQKGIKVKFVHRGDKMVDEKLEWYCLNPPEEYETDDINQISETFLLQYKTFTILLTGDLTGDAEYEVIKDLQKSWKKDARLTVLKVAHHGSKYSTPTSLLELTRPEFAVISAGENNSYGHPHEELLERLQDVQTPWYNTEEVGAIRIRTDGLHMWIKKYK